MQRPAIITSVVDNTTVNLAVMTDIQDSLPCPLLVLNVEAGTARRQWSVPTAQSAVRSTPAPATKSETQDEK
ncbi:MAG: hypothetical protein HY962_07200 [Ignavibacteriae bacterium]|nr:hypothetical protein [Ignavibacteriota bacterium]